MLLSSSSYLTEPFTITIPSYPNITYKRITHSQVDKLSSVFSDTPQELDSLRERVIQNNSVEVMIEVDGVVEGYAGIVPIDWVEMEGSIGIQLNESIRGRGIGKLTVSVLSQICFDMGIVATLGTMKSNTAMRGVMKGLGVVEREEVVVVEGRGVVAEVVFEVEREGWKEVEMVVEFEDEHN